jgi:hypothetical protein
MTTIPRRAKSSVALGLGSIIVGALTIGRPASTSAMAYTPWSRDDAYNFGLTGLGEKYGGVGTGNSQWVDDNVPNDQFGADCSGYAGKTWQMSSGYHSSATNDRIYPSSGDWYNENGLAQSLGAVKIAMNDSRTRRMDVWAHNGHMGLFEGTQDIYGQWKIWHAASPSLNILLEYKPDSYFDGNKRFKRSNW